MKTLNQTYEKKGERIFTDNASNLETVLKVFPPVKNVIAEFFIGPAKGIDIESVVLDKGIVPEMRYDQGCFQAGKQALYCFVKNIGGEVIGPVSQDIRCFQITDKKTATNFLESFCLNWYTDFTHAIGKIVNVYKNALDLYAVGTFQWR